MLKKSDIVEKESKFFHDLQSIGITEEPDINYYENHNYVVESNKVIDEVKELHHRDDEYNEEKCKNYLKLFTKINTLRKGQNDLGFDDCKFIILTGNKFVKNLAHHNEIKANNNSIPFVTDIDFITNRFWFKLNKGFGKSDGKPRSFDIIARAQMVLAAQMNNTVHKEYVDFKKRYNDKNITKEEQYFCCTR